MFLYNIVACDSRNSSFQKRLSMALELVDTKVYRHEHYLELIC